MTASKQPDFAELNALAIEACDMWQEHLSTLAQDPQARAELTRFLEPQRRLFADWASMMQKGATSYQRGGGHDGNGSSHAGPAGTSPAGTTAEPSTEPPAEPSSRGAQHGDDSLRVAQLALRVAELEKRLARLEARAAQPSRGTQRSAS